MNKTFVALLVGFSALAGVAAHADTVLLERHAFELNYEGTGFRFDAANGAAWMEVHLAERVDMPVDMVPPAPIVRRATVKVQVAGLSYDAAAAQILFTGEVGKVVCATITEKHGMFGTKSIITLTGACRTYQRFENRGYSVYFEAK